MVGDMRGTGKYNGRSDDTPGLGETGETCCMRWHQVK